MNRLPRTWWWRGAALIVAAGAGAGVCWVYLLARQAQDLADPNRARQQDRPIPVRTDLVSQSQVEEVIGATAVTTPSEKATVSIGNSEGFEIMAPVLKKILVREGNLVRQGQLLFTLDDAPLVAVQLEAEAARTAAAADEERVKREVALAAKLRDMELASAEAEVSFRTDDLDSRKRLYETLEKLPEGSTNLLELYEARSRYAQARFHSAEAERRLQRARDAMTIGPLRDAQALTAAAARLAETRRRAQVAAHDVQRCQIKSPLDGYIDKHYDVPGQTVDVVNPLAHIVKIDPIHVRMDFPVERIDSLALGQKAEVILDCFPKETFTGTVIRINPDADPKSRVLPVVIEVANPQHRIKPGVTGFARLRLSKKATLVPATAVIQRGSKAMVFRIEDGRARIRAIETGPLLEAGVLEVRAGLAAGEEVVVYGTASLQDNDPVDANWRRWARRD